MAAIVENLQGSGTPYVVAALVAGSRNPKAANAQHREILQAVRARDVKAAKKHMRDHVDKTLVGVPERLPNGS